MAKLNFVCCIGERSKILTLILNLLLLISFIEQAGIVAWWVLLLISWAWSIITKLSLWYNTSFKTSRQLIAMNVTYKTRTLYFSSYDKCCTVRNIVSIDLITFLHFTCNCAKTSQIATVTRLQLGFCSILASFTFTSEKWQKVRFRLLCFSDNMFFCSIRTQRL